jgi:hypothetical protein
MNINIQVVPNEAIKVRKGFTGADWWVDSDFNIQVRVASELTDWREQACLAIHEAAEAIMCLHLGVTVQQVDDYDAKFEREHPGDGTTNVGDLADCPYRLPHNAATAMERVLAGVLDVPWQAYDDRLAAL